MKKVRFSAKGEDGDLSEEEEGGDTQSSSNEGTAESQSAGKGAEVNTQFNNGGSDQMENYERALKSCQHLEFQLREKEGAMKTLEEQLQQLKLGDGGKSAELQERSNKLAELDTALAEANESVNRLVEESRTKEGIISELYVKLSDALDSSAKLNEKQGEENEELRKRIASLEATLQKTEQKLASSNEEKEYYKKQQFNTNNVTEKSNEGSSAYSNSMNGSIGDRDDFGHELMVANRRKYQLEGRVRQLELEFHDSQQLVQSHERELRNTEKLLWLEKERSATLEHENRQLHQELNDLRSGNDALKQKLETYRTTVGEPAVGGQSDATLMTADATFQAKLAEQLQTPPKASDAETVEWYENELERRQRDFDIRIQDVLDLKTRVECRLGEVTQSWHDAKWRVGELEATLAHKEYEYDQLTNRAKQLESVLATPVNNMSGEIQRLEEELGKVRDGKNKSDWHLGEYKQWLDGAKWRVGELETELRNRTQYLDEAHMRIGGLERRTWELEDQLRRAGHDNELPRLVEELREQKCRVEWRLGEVTQYWNDAKWRVGELETTIGQRDGQLRELTDRLGRLPDAGRMSHLSSGFIVSKQQSDSRHTCQNLITLANLCGGHDSGELRRAWFEVEVDASIREVFLIGSFVAWELAILMQSVSEGNGLRKLGVWVELPLGRHEFRFVTGGVWCAMSNYPRAPNEYGEANNWMMVE